MGLFESHEATVTIPHTFRAFGRVKRGQYIGTDDKPAAVAVAWRHEATREEQSVEGTTKKRREAECTISRFPDHASYPGVDRPQLGATIKIEDASGHVDEWKIDSLEKVTASYCDLILVHFGRMKVNRLEGQL